MPITIGVGLEEDGAGGILGSVSGNGEGFGEVWEMQDGAGQEKLFQVIE